MAVLVGKAHYLVLDRGAVTRAYALDHARVKGRAVQIRAYDLVRFFVGIGEVTRPLVFRRALAHVGKGVYVRFAALYFQRGIIYASAVYAGGRARFETTDGKTEADEGGGQFVRGGETGRSARPLPFARVTLPFR